ncbi:hypothetical protein [Roseibium sediminicola]|uniref:Uncharacterized protein n=1 Tax=Roseibium sediminicola TaxID=2933272 RepID=A0ABT0GZV1_9HYPH|nr:hypothetical protein [Roseibium sp. CAU 1639]MCK7614592.1 hypothetical protein [Roseibium sp. CAU 1639]
MGTIRLSRAAGIIDMFRAYQIVLDGEFVGKIKRGGTVEIELEKGRHALQLQIDWCRSNTVLFDAGDTIVCFECGNNFDGKKLLAAPFHLIFPRGDYLWLNKA